MPDFLAVADGKAFWSLQNNSGLLQAPLTGGKATRFPARPTSRFSTGPGGKPALAVATHGTIKNQNRVGYKKARNLLTGETRTAKIQHPASGTAGSSLSAPSSTARERSGPRLRDGTQSRIAPIQSGPFIFQSPFARPLHLGHAGQRIDPYDFRTGKIGTSASKTSALRHTQDDSALPGHGRRTLI